MPIRLFTIGFTKKSAAEFFALLQGHGVEVVADTRLKPDSQLSGFAKGRDLAYFLEHLIGCQYRYMPEMAPTEELMNQYRRDNAWEQYEAGFERLMRTRNLIAQLDRTWWTTRSICLLCSEHEPDHCHRRLVAEYIAAYWPEVQIHHLT